ncbi:pilus assembly protein PilM [Legionella worsleiensis]|uniref:Tfp pilus assembly protein, ATPase PilM n=1 Tax=Legionella worsleiensis TaxID=45076 RepID=A0A0W1A970_9GAMM|nr:pilus assembly protein PilM [Legionella worsleiensis]KTD77828.1 Tfp pilus assembly protein, ATPase PilM [Legionella worsleiensis]STY33070.1 type IV pilus assembly protein PilM [Legionella worsleiensis]
MLKLFKPKHRAILGIDISSSAVKILEISGTGEHLCVEGYGRQLLPPNALDGNVIKDIDAVASTIKQVIQTARLNCKQVALAVPDSAVISKVVQMNDGLNDAELEELVVIEADKYIPYPIDEINLDFEILGHSAKNSAMVDVLIVASRAENVQSRVEAVTRAGLEAKIVDVESYAVERAAQQLAAELPAGGQDKIVAIVDIGANYTHLFVLHGMKLIFSREEKFGGMQLIDAIAEHYGMPHEHALIAKEQGKLPPDYTTEVLEPFKEMVLLQIKRTLQFFYSSSQHGFVDHILLAGGLARQEGLAALIQEQIGVSTTVANPLLHMVPGKMVNLESINNDAPALMVACGLALRHLE